MCQASKPFSDQQRRQIEEAVAAAEAKASCEIIPVVATVSGRYDRPEDLIGLWLAFLAAVSLWLALPGAAEQGTWDTLPQLTAALGRGHATDAICELSAEAGSQLARPFPRAAGGRNELANSLVLIDGS